MLEGLRLYFGLVIRKWPYLLLAMILMATAAGFQTAVPFAIGELIDTLGDPARSSRAPLIMFGILSFGAFAALHLSALYSRYFVPRLRMFVQEQLFAHALRQPPIFFRSVLGGAVGDAIKQCGRTSVLISQIMTEDTVRLIAAFGVALALLVFDGLWVLSVGLFVWAIAFFALAGLFAQAARPSIKEFSQASRVVAGEIVDTVSNYDAIRTAHTFATEKARLQNMLAIERDRNIESRGKLILMSVLHGAASWVLILAIAGYCAVAVPGSMTVGQAATVITLSIVLSNLSQNFSRTLMEFFETLERFRDSYRALGDARPVTALTASTGATPDLGQHNTIPAFAVKDVTLGYEESAKPILKNLTFEVPQGAMVGIVGRSGVGKSTLLDAMMHVLPVRAGTISLAGHSVDTLDEATLARLISYVPQAPRLFSRSLRDNLRYENPEASDDALWAALETSASIDVVRNRVDGLATQAGVEGRKLSVGERQRLVVARALVADKPILLLDEPTSALDAVASNAVATAIEALSARGKTIIYVTHQLMNTRHADMILVFDQGEIAQSGRHDDLVSVPGPYRNLWQRQQLDDADPAIVSFRPEVSKG